jgi:branched-chain amino acid transport system ATP-binding protein
MTAQAPLLRVEKVNAGYDGLPVVRELEIAIQPGEVVTMLGPNGAGKTTTLATIAGLLPAIGGEISFDGQRIDGAAAHSIAKLGVSLVPEGRALFFSLTVRDHLRLAGGRGGLQKEQLFELFPELEKCYGRKAGVLSGGEQQMLAVGRGLISRPRLLLVDEMSIGLAPVIVERMLPVLRRIANEFGTAVLFVEQHVALALEVADRAYVLNHGRIVLEGPAAELREQRDLLRASYLGEAATEAVQ